MAFRPEVLLDLLAGGSTGQAYGISDDSEIIAGVADNGVHSFAVTWTKSGGDYGAPANLGVLAGSASSLAWGISADGTTVFGESDWASGLHTDAFAWTSGGGMVQLAAPPSPATFPFSAAFKSSANGSVIFGTAKTAASPSDPVPVVWTGAGWTTITLLAFPAGAFNMTIAGCTSDGTKVIGSYLDAGSVLHAVSWTFSGSWGAATALPTFDGNVVTPVGISADGSVMAGYALDSLSVQQALRWTSGTGWVAIGIPSGETAPMYATAMSSDGSTIGGSAHFGGDVFIWSLATGFDDLSGTGAPNGFSSDGAVGAGTDVGLGRAAYWAFLAPEVRTATLADLWFGPTDRFVDLTVGSNRRNFISTGGGTQNLGTTGQNPFGASPPVFLTRDSDPATFATNSGRGGAFDITDGPLDAGATNPPGTSSTVTTFTPGSSGQGVLGDYLTGNLYAFNTTTLTDNGQKRKWVRRWRGLPRDTNAAVKFNSLNITMETGIGVPSTPTYALNVPFTGMTFDGGTGFELGEVVALSANDGRQLVGASFFVTAISGSGTITAGTFASPGSFTFALPTGFTQASSDGDGTGLTISITDNSLAYAQVTTPNPQLMLRWSDDGGFTWGPYRILPVGKKGETAFTVKANRMGMTRRFSGSDRIFELSSTDPFEVSITGAEVDAS